MAFHPILFTGEMIRANLEGRKTQTRRVVVVGKTVADQTQWILTPTADGAGLHRTSADGIVLNTSGGKPSSGMQDKIIRCPYGVPGDILWARESWLQWQCEEHSDSAFPCDCKKRFAYRADGEISAVRWKPSIHMPKWACRLWCRIESIRVERVQEIGWQDAIAEGMKDPRRSMLRIDENRGPAAAYAKLWNTINAKRGFGWKANPWVWAITYTPTTTPPDGWAEYCQK